MRDIERKIEKLEQRNSPDSQYTDDIEKCFDEAGLNIIERVGILVKLGFVTGETIAKLIREGSRKQNNELEDNIGNK